jgi:5'-3' exonuclease
MANRIILIDSTNIQFRAVFSYRKNPQIPATWLYLNMITAYLNALKVDLDDKIILAQDFGSWRKEVDPTYKAQRKDYRESLEEKKWWDTRFKEFNDLYIQLDASTPWYLLKSYKAESDDWASVACRVFTDKEIILCSSDKDWEMLAYFKNVKIYSPLKKGKNRFKDIPHPLRVLQEKIQGDVSDNLITKPSSEVEFFKRKQIVDLINPLPEYIENPLKEKLMSLFPKNLQINLVPFPSIRKKMAKIYNIQ